MPAKSVAPDVPSFTAIGVLDRATFSINKLPAVAGDEVPPTRSVRMATAVLVKELSSKVTEPTVSGLALPLVMSKPTEQLLTLIDLYVHPQFHIWLIAVTES